MKFAIGSLVLGMAMGPYVNACPLLSGQYTCSAKGKVERMDIEQTDKEPIRYYFIDPSNPSDRSDYVDADGVEYPAGRDDSSARNKKVKAFCDVEALRVDNYGDFYFRGQYTGKYLFKSTITKSNGVVTMVRVESFPGLPVATETVICRPR